MSIRITLCKRTLGFYGHSHIQLLYRSLVLVTCHTWLQSARTDVQKFHRWWAKAARQATCTKEQILANSNYKQAHTKRWSHNAHRGCNYSNAARSSSFMFILTGRLGLFYRTAIRWSPANMVALPLVNKNANSTLGQLHNNYKAVFLDSDGWLSAWNATCQAILLHQMNGRIGWPLMRQ